MSDYVHIYGTVKDGDQLPDPHKIITLTGVGGTVTIDEAGRVHTDNPVRLIAWYLKHAR